VADVGALAGLRPRRVPGYTVKLLQDCTRAELDVGRRERGGRASAGTRISSSSTTSLLGAPVGVASGLRYVVKAHGSELEY
jgi:hypothetical protein